MYSEFTEIQKFSKWWHYLIASFPLIIISLMFILVQFDFVKTKNQEKEPFIFLSIIAFLVLVFIWFIFLKLKTLINQNGIYINYFGIPFCKRTITWEEIESISVIKYSPLYDYGGWGVRYSLTGNGWCYNVAGDYGIKIIRSNSKPFLIGTQQKEEAEKIIHHYFNKQ